ncbi:GFA family protein [Sphingomonas sp. So64.6b]|uniref:GFA family protein n=1 Tax=Sphingomonas sp. So64.6b TaxID=2997354 RepID=UPI0016009B80|nr:GFA family protein [Sphingomonas sp. So64.6b]QNA85174.1 GFA family protein [Sphingomonas sp. So64.6b]
MRQAQCRCGQLSATVAGDPVRVSVCHCLACQRRTGSAFAAQARFAAANVTITGDTRSYVRRADSGRQVIYRFCPECGSTMAYENPDMPGLIAIPLGNFADPAFPAPTFSFYESRKHHWTAILGEDVFHED